MALTDTNYGHSKITNDMLAAVKLYQQNIISAQTLCEMIGVNWDEIVNDRDPAGKLNRIRKYIDNDMIGSRFEILDL